MELGTMAGAVSRSKNKAGYTATQGGVGYNPAGLINLITTVTTMAQDNNGAAA